MSFLFIRLSVSSSYFSTSPKPTLPSTSWIKMKEGWFHPQSIGQLNRSQGNDKSSQFFQTSKGIAAELAGSIDKNDQWVSVLWLVCISCCSLVMRMSREVAWIIPLLVHIWPFRLKKSKLIWSMIKIKTITQTITMTTTMLNSRSKKSKPICQNVFVAEMIHC